MEGWMGFIRIKENKYSYKEKDRRLQEQFINGKTDNDMMTNIIRELTTIKKTDEIPSRQVLCWARIVEVQLLCKAVQA